VKTIIYVNQHVIRENTKNGTNEPAILPPGGHPGRRGPRNRLDRAGHVQPIGLCGKDLDRNKKFSQNP
jgi:hypothetical protein